ncbi:MAG: response regulator [Anaerolineae bacterium]|nr:response regulator [Anaerolineae bacterium]
MAQERILIVEDDAEIGRIIKQILTDARYEVLHALDGQTGLEMALQEDPNLILLDLNLPRMSGMELLQTLRDQNSLVPVILVSAQRSEHIAIQALRLGVRDYLQKPFTVQELQKAVKRALQETQIQREREHLLAELERANRLLGERMRELSVLQAVGRSVAALVTRDKALVRIAETAAYLSQAQAVAIFLPEPNGKNLSLEAVQWNIARQVVLYQHIEDRYAQQTMTSGQPLWVRDLRDGSHFVGQLGHYSDVILYIPIKLGERTIGVMGAAFPKQQKPTLETQHRLSTLADYAAVALKNAQLYEASRQQASQLATINQTAQMVTSSLDLNKVMQAIVRSVNQILHVQAGSLALLDSESNELVFQINLRGDTEELAPFRLQVGEGIIGWVVQTGQPARINDVAADPRFYAHIDHAIDFKTRSVLCVPLAVANQVIGAIEVINKFEDAEGKPGPFTEQDESLLCSIAAFVAMAVENARLHQAMRETIASQTLHNTVVTLSHHINNPLQVLFTLARSLRAELNDSALADALEHESAKIASVIEILQDLVSPQSTLYLNTTQMFDIEAEIARRLA